MPQELALISQFTIKETLQYYAGFCNTDCNVFAKRMQLLLNLLDLTHFENKFVDKLSGGQKRRVSLAIALINNPPLLILDEPTVGVDPILREAIWSYLVKISKEGLTVIGF
jgi:ABC-type multidrug transport system ATPase subunit